MSRILHLSFSARPPCPPYMRTCSQCNNYEKIKIKYIIYILLKLKIIIYKNKNNYKKFKINKLINN